MEGQVVRTIRDFLTTKDGELCVNRDEYLQVSLRYYIIKVQQNENHLTLNYCHLALNILR